MILSSQPKLAVIVYGDNMITERDIGKRCVVNGKVSGRKFCDEKGVIKSVSTINNFISIEFDRDMGLHDCNGVCIDGYGYFIPGSKVTMIEEEYKSIW